MSKIKIKRNTNGDTRTAVNFPSEEDFNESNWLHKSDVNRVMKELAKEIESRGQLHDWTKVVEPYKGLFYAEFKHYLENNKDFSDSHWYELHCEEERHHLLSRTPEDVNLIDVLEMIVDCVCAGLTRSGKVRPVEIDADILLKAVQNTENLIKSMVELED